MGADAPYDPSFEYLQRDTIGSLHKLGSGMAVEGSGRWLLGEWICAIR